MRTFLVDVVSGARACLVGCRLAIGVVVASVLFIVWLAVFVICAAVAHALED